MAQKLITFQDVDGSIRAQIMAYLEQYKKDHPGISINFSSVSREALVEGLAILRGRAKPRLEDKIKTGSLRK